MEKNLMDKLMIPCSYHGGKQRAAKQIIDYIIANDFIFPSDNGTKIYDLCCGSGAITLEFINRGVSPKNITMCDISSWGKFWKSIGDGTFSIEKFDYYCNQVPKDKSKVHDFMVELSKTSTLEDGEYKYILLQSASFGGKQIWETNGKWMNATFRNHWMPTETSKRRSPVNPMSPSIDTLKARVHMIAERCVGLNVIHNDIHQVTSVIPKENAIIYIDPPYANTTGYQHSFNLDEFLSELFDITLSPIYVSEYEPLSEECAQLNINTKKSGINGNRVDKGHQEWLSVFR